MKSKTCLITAGLSGAFAVALGALGAHALKGELSAELLDSYKTGNAYHIYHSIALLVLPALKSRIGNTNMLIIYFLWLAGIVLFSGSIYLLSLRELMDASWLTVLGPVTPLGGVLIILGWVFVAISAFKSS